MPTLAEAIDHLEDHDVDAVLLDLGLGETEGLATLEAFEATTPRELPVVVLTGLDDQKIAETAMQAGAQDYLVKGRSRGRDILRALRYAIARKLEQQGYEQALRRKVEIDRLEAESAFKTRFLNMAAHELATPLTPVLFQLHAMRDGHLGDLTTDQAHAVEVMDRGLGRLSRMIQDLLLASRLQAEGAPVDRRATDLASQLTALAEQARGRGVELDLTVDPGLSAEVDRELFDQAIGRLMTFAVDHAEQGDRIDVRATGDDQGLEVELRCPGISADGAEGLFEPYSQSIQVEGHRAKGTGLGLYIAKALIERHGGQLEAVPLDPGPGARLRVHLPVDGGPPPSGPGSVPSHS